MEMLLICNVVTVLSNVELFLQFSLIFLVFIGWCFTLYQLRCICLMNWMYLGTTCIRAYFKLSVSTDFLSFFFWVYVNSYTFPPFLFFSLSHSWSTLGTNFQKNNLFKIFLLFWDMLQSSSGILWSSIPLYVFNFHVFFNFHYITNYIYCVLIN